MSPSDQKTALKEAFQRVVFAAAIGRNGSTYYGSFERKAFAAHLHLKETDRDYARTFNRLSDLMDTPSARQLSDRLQAVVDMESVFGAGLYAVFSIARHFPTFVELTHCDIKINRKAAPLLDRAAGIV